MGDQAAPALAATEALLESLARLGAVNARPHGGGFGLFVDEVMFAVVDPDGAAHLRVPPGAGEHYPEQWGDPPYGRIPASVLEDDSALLLWAQQSLDAARAAGG